MILGYFRGENNPIDAMLTSLLSVAFEKAQILPQHLQDELAQQLIADIEDEIQWPQTLEQEQSCVLEELAQAALAASLSGETQVMGFDEL